jgi:predicted homoserine dehydrogenase-like protein
MPSPSERIKIIQVGAGAIGRLWLDVVAGSADLELVGLIDLDLAAAQRSAASAGLPDVVLARWLPELPSSDLSWRPGRRCTM